MEKRERAVLIYSGGLDSTVLLHYLTKHENREVLALSVDYGQRHRKELLFAAANCRKLGISYWPVDLSALNPILRGSSQTSSEISVPEGHYAEESMKLTVVPNRNMLMLSAATALAISQKATKVCYAAHAGDHTIYPDCRPEFVEALGKAILLADWSQIQLEAPFVDSPKARIVQIGDSLGVDFKLTWSCYKGGEKHCGKCGTCVERKEAFVLAGVPDPTEYE